MNSRRLYSNINLTSLLDVVFLTLFLLVLTMGDHYQTTTVALDQREQVAASRATVALVAAEETVIAVQLAAQATAEAAAATSQQHEATVTVQAQSQAATATHAALALAEQGAALATSEARLVASHAEATAAAQQASAQGTAEATITAVARHANQQAAAASTQVALADQNAAAAEATAVAVQSTAAAMLANAEATQRAAAAESMAAQMVMATAQSMQQGAQELYQDTQQILAAEVTDPGITIAKARWVDKYATFYLIRLSPYVEGRSTLEIFRGGTFLGSREIALQAQIRDFLTALDRNDVADTLVILTFSPDSSDNHRQWILDYLDTYNFKYQRVQEESGQESG